jgi:hypothetical protein
MASLALLRAAAGVVEDHDPFMVAMVVFGFLRCAIAKAVDTSSLVDATPIVTPVIMATLS